MVKLKLTEADFPRVTLKEDGLALEFCVKNNNSRRDFPEDLRAKMLLHNYFLVRVSFQRLSLEHPSR